MALGADLERLLEQWEGELVALRRDRRSGAWMIVCVHSTRLGPTAGGTRLKPYANLAAAVADGQRLASAMTLKFAVHDLPFGGGKSVLVVETLPWGEERRRLLHEFGTFVDSLGGLYSCAPDMNTSAQDMDVISERTSHVFCRTNAAGGSGDTGPDTAVGVFHGIRASARHRFGSDMAGRSVLVQGLGSVGTPLAELLLAAGARVLVADTEPARVERLVARGGVPVDVSAVIATSCDVFAPCATGGIVSAETIPSLRCQIVAGAANNQLAEPEDGERLAERGILYAPDYVINTGGVLHGIGIEVLGWSRAELDQRLEAIGEVLVEIYRRAEAEGIATEAAAGQLARARLEAGAPAADGTG